MYISWNSVYDMIVLQCQMMMDGSLMLMVLALVIINATIITVWQVIDPYSVIIKDIEDSSVSSNTCSSIGDVLW